VDLEREKEDHRSRLINSILGISWGRKRKSSRIGERERGRGTRRASPWQYVIGFIRDDREEGWFGKKGRNMNKKLKAGETVQWCGQEQSDVKSTTKRKNRSVPLGVNWEKTLRGFSGTMKMCRRGEKRRDGS